MAASQTLPQILSPTFLPETYIEDLIDAFTTMSEVDAETKLSEFAAKTSHYYGVFLLHFVSNQSSSDENVCRLAIARLINHLEAGWRLLPDLVKDAIRTLMVRNILSASPEIEAAICKALLIVGTSLLPELNATLDEAIFIKRDLLAASKILTSLSVVFNKFRSEWTSELLSEHSYCLNNFFTRLIGLFKNIEVCSVSNVTAVNLRLLVQARCLCCRIFYSLSYYDLHQVFVESRNTWMVEFHTYLASDYSTLEGHGGDDLKLVEELRAAVYENISLYMEKEWGPFGEYLVSKEHEFHFQYIVFDLVVSKTPSSERLMLAGIKFLTIVSLNLRFPDEALKQFCQMIPIHYVMLRDADKQLFEEDYVEFIRRDIEGGGLDDRRRIACEFLKGIGRNNQEKVATEVLQLINDYLNRFNGNPSTDWKYMECAIYLVISMDIENAGHSIINWNDFKWKYFLDNVKAALQYGDINYLPMLKASALKFISVYMNLILKHDVMEIIPYVISFLTSKSNVVHSYAGSCIEKLLLVKDAGGQARYTSVDIGSYVFLLTANLFDALKKTGSKENHHIMRCIMRVADVSDEVVSLMMMMNLNSILDEVCQNPKSPIFEYYLFESLAILIRRGCQNDYNILPMFEKIIFPSLLKIFSEDVSKLIPYAVQLSTQLMNLRHCFFAEYITFAFSSATMPTSAIWLQSFIQNIPRELNREEPLLNVLNLLQRLLESPSTCDQGFYGLKVVIGRFEHAEFANHMTPIWLTIFAGLHMDVRTSNFAKGAIIFMSLFMVKQGFQAFVDSVTAAAANKDVFLELLKCIWIPYLKLISGRINIKLTSVASAKLVYTYLSQSPSDPAAGKLGGRMFDSIVTLLTKKEVRGIPFEETVRYSSTSVYLHNVSTTEDDHLEEIIDPIHNLVSTLADSGTARKIIWNNVSDKTRSKLTKLCVSYNVPGDSQDLIQVGFNLQGEGGLS